MSDAPVLKSLKPDAWPDTIHAHKAVIRFPNGVESGNWQSKPDEKSAEYTRSDLIPALIDEAVAREREACAKEADKRDFGIEESPIDMNARIISRAIRARGNGE
jgi:hypothetical protein